MFLWCRPLMKGFATYHSIETKSIAAQIAQYIWRIKTIWPYIQRIGLWIIHILQLMSITWGCLIIFFHRLFQLSCFIRNFVIYYLVLPVYKFQCRFFMNFLHLTQKLFVFANGFPPLAFCIMQFVSGQCRNPCVWPISWSITLNNCS